MITKEEFKDVELGLKIKIENFLKEHKDNAYTIEEIRQNIPTTKTNTSSALRQLYIKGKVEHKKPYWIYKEEIITLCEEELK